MMSDGPLAYGAAWLLGFLSAGAALAAPPGSGVPSHITPLMGAARQYDCRSVSLTPSNVIGLLSTEHDAQTVSATVLYRTDGRSERIRLRLMKPDAEILEAEIGAMLRQARTRPIRFEASRGREGECRFTRVAG